MIRLNLAVYRNILFAHYSHNGKQYKFSLGMRIRPDQWDKKRQRIKPSAPGAAMLQRSVDIAASEFLEIVYRVLENGEMSYEAIKQVRNQPAEDFFRLYRSYLDNNMTIRESTRKKKYSTYNVIRRYCENKGIVPGLNYWTPEKFGLFVKYLQFDLDLRDSSIARHAKQLKAFLRHSGVTMDMSHISYSEGPSSVIYLNSPELEIIWKYKLSGQYDLWRDYLIFMCYTGMRYSDAVECNETWIDENSQTITYVQQKTTGIATIPYLTKPHLILTKYDGQLPPLSNQKLNKGLKKLFTYIGLTRKVAVEYSKGGKIVREWKPINEVVTSHIGRKTFIMRAVLAEVPQDMLKKMSGHRGEIGLRPYINIAARHVEKYRDRLD